MKKIINIFLILSILLLLAGAVSATNIDDLKVPQNCNPLKDGKSSFTNHINRTLNVESVEGDYKTDYFTNTSDMTINNMGDNIYLYEDAAMGTYGYQEIVNIDGETYMVSIDQDSQLSPSEEKMLLEDMKDFNKKNNLETVEI